MAALVRFIQISKASYTALQTKDMNALYFCLDSHELYKGDVIVASHITLDDVNTSLGNKVDKVTGYSLVSDTEIAKLLTVSEGANKVEASTTNGNVKIDGVETKVYELPVATDSTLGGVIVDNASIVIDATNKISVKEVAASKITGVVAEAAKVTNALTAGSKTFDGSAPITITAADLQALQAADIANLVSNDTVATDATLGLVKAGTDVTVDRTGVLGLANVGTQGSYYKVTTDAKGRVVSGQTALEASDIPSLTAEKITDLGDMALLDEIAETNLSSDLQTKINAKANAADVYAKTETYSAEEIDAKLSSVYRYKGSVDNYSDLPTSGMVEGDVYNVKNASAENNVEAGDNVAWVGGADGHWDVLSGVVDLSSYSTTEQVNGLISTAVSPLMSKVSAGDANEILVAGADGDASASGVTLGGATLAETPSEYTVATEAAVNAALVAALEWEVIA